MSPEDDALFQEAKDWYNKGSHLAAHKQFCDLYLNNRQDASMLCWIGYSTPNLDEARQALSDVERLKPYHPSLPKLRERVSQLEQIAAWENRQKQVHKPLEMTCPYCHYTGPVRTKGRIAVGGWIWFAACFLGFIGLLVASSLMASTVVPDYLLSQIQQNINATQGCSFIFLLLSPIGFFIRKRRYVCGQCGIALGDRI
jgi:hypothetical protein